MSCGIGHRQGSDPALLWLWCRPAAVAPIGPLAWKPSYATGATLKRKKKIILITSEVQQTRSCPPGPLMPARETGGL